MGARYDNIAGVQHKVSKRYDCINGIWRPVSKRYDNIAGVWRPGYSNGIEWTYSITKTLGRVDSYAVTADQTFIASLSTGNSNNDRAVEITFTFNSPIKLPAASAFNFYYVSTLGAAVCQVWLNGNFVHAEGQSYQTNVNLSADTDVTTIMVGIYSNSKSNTYSELRLTLNPIGSPSFLLNNAGYANT